MELRNTLSMPVHALNTSLNSGVSNTTQPGSEARPMMEVIGGGFSICKSRAETRATVVSSNPGCQPTLMWNIKRRWRFVLELRRAIDPRMPPAHLDPRERSHSEPFHDFALVSTVPPIPPLFQVLPGTQLQVENAIPLCHLLRVLL